MALPFNTEYPSSVIKMITPEEVNLQIPFPSGLPGWTDQESARVVAVLRNTAGELAYNNAARMFCYNALMENGCNNAFFQEVLSMCFSRIKEVHAKTPNLDIHSLVKQSVNFVLTCVTAVLPYQYDELKSLVDYKFIKDGEKYVSHYDNLKRGTNEMSWFNQSQQQQIMVQCQVSNGPDGFPYLLVRSNVGFDSNYRINQTANGYFIQVGSLTLHIAQTNMGTQVIFNNKQGSVEDFFASVVIPEAMKAEQQRQSGFANSGFGNSNQNNGWSTGNTMQTNMPTSIFAPAASSAVTQQSSGEMSALARKAAEITRNQALNQGRMGGVTTDFTQNTTQSNQAADAATINSLSDEGKIMSMTQAEAKFEAFDDESADAFVRRVQGRDLDFYGELFAVESVSLAAQRVLSEGLLSKNGVCRRFGAVYQQFPTIMPQISDYISRLVSVSQMDELGTRISKLIESVGVNIEKRQGVEELRSLRAAFIGVNRQLTTLVNNFINYSLASAADSKLKTTKDETGYPKPIFDSFCEDIGDVCTLLDRRLESNAKLIWREFQKNLMSGLLAFDPNIQASYQSEAPEGIYNLCLPINISVTYLNAMSVDLGFKETRAVVVDGAVSSALLSVCNSLIRSKAMVSETAVDYLVTMDGKIFAIYQNSDSKWVLVEKH